MIRLPVRKLSIGWLISALLLALLIARPAICQKPVETMDSSGLTGSASLLETEQEVADVVSRAAVRAVRRWATLDAGPAEVVLQRRQGHIVYMHCRKTWFTHTWFGKKQVWQSDVFVTMVRKPGLRSVINVDYQDNHPICASSLGLVRVIPAVNESLAKWDRVYGEPSEWGAPMMPVTFPITAGNAKAKLR